MFTDYAIAFSPDGQSLATGSGDETIQLNLQTQTSTKVLRGHDIGVTIIASTPDGRQLVSDAIDGPRRLLLLR